MRLAPLAFCLVAAASMAAVDQGAAADGHIGRGGVAVLGAMLGAVLGMMAGNFAAIALERDAHRWSTYGGWIGAALLAYLNY